MYNTKRIFTFLLMIFFVSLTISYSSSKIEGYTLFSRNFEKDSISNRAYMSIPALSSVLYEPFGAGGLSDHYRNIAYKRGWAVGSNARSAHNHFASVIMYTGIFGMVLIALLVNALWKKLKLIRLFNQRNDLIVLVVGCISVIIHSFTHNAGFFAGERATWIVFGLLWSGTQKTLIFPSQSRKYAYAKAQGKSSISSV